MRILGFKFAENLSHVTGIDLTPVIAGQVIVI
jgi:hypothetical protein